MNRFPIFLMSASGALAPLVFDSALKGVALLGLAGGGVLLMRRASAATRHLVWLTAVVALLVLPVLSVGLPQWRVLPEWVASASPIVPAPVSRAPRTMPERVMASAPVAESEPAEVAPIPAEPALVTRVVGEPAQALKEVRAEAPPVGVAKPVPWSWQEWLPILWGAGFVFLSLRLLAARFLLWRSEKNGVACESGPLAEGLEAVRRQIGVRQRVRLLVDERCTMPMVWGVFRPRLVLPAEAKEWSAAQLHSVFLHELAHIRRRDPVAQWLIQIACALHWFNPLVWLAAWRLHAERERACDDLVLTAGVGASEYASHLLHIAAGQESSRWTQACGLAMARPSRLEGRLIAVLSQKMNRRRVTRAAALVVSLLGAVVLVPVATLCAGDPAKSSPAPAAEPAVMQPQSLTARSLLRKWQRSALGNGNIPAVKFKQLALQVGQAFSSVEGEEKHAALVELVAELKAPRDRTLAETVALLDRVDAVTTIPVSSCESQAMIAATGRVQRGQPLPEKLRQAPWGPAAENGLRAAWMFEPAEPAYAIGEAPSGRILFHNAGSKPVLFVTDDDRSKDQWNVTDGKGRKFAVIPASGRSLLATRYRLQPGEYCELAVLGLGLGDEKFFPSTEENIFPKTRGLSTGDVVGEIEPLAAAYLPVEAGTDLRISWTLSTQAEAYGWSKELGPELFSRYLAEEGDPGEDPAERARYVRRVTRDLLGVEATAEEVKAFVADDRDDAVDALARRLRRSPENLPVFDQPLITGEVKFHVDPPKANGVKTPQIAIEPKSYWLGSGCRLVVERPSARLGDENRARVAFFRRGVYFKELHPPYEIPLPEGIRSSGFVWQPGGKELWLVQKGALKRIDFADPRAVREESRQMEDPTIPEPLREAFQKVLQALNPPVEVVKADPVEPGAESGPVERAAPKPTPAAAGTPKSERARALWSSWHNSMRLSGKIPAANVAQLGRDLDELLAKLKEYGKEDAREELLAIRQQLKRGRDWSVSEAAELLDRLDAIHPSVVERCAARERGASRAAMNMGQPLPQKLREIPWGPAAPNGLRAAYVLDPAQPSYEISQIVNVQILLQNTGNEVVQIITESMGPVAPTLRDAQGKELQVNRIQYAGNPTLERYRLAPGEYCRMVSAGVRIGERVGEEKKINIQIGGPVGAELALKPGDEVQASWPAEFPPVMDRLMAQVGQEGGKKASAEDFFRWSIEGAGPPPVNRAERELYLRRLSLYVFGVHAKAEDVAAFVADETPQALDHLVERWLRSPENVPPFEGTLKTGTATLRVKVAGAEKQEKPVEPGGKARPVEPKEANAAPPNFKTEFAGRLFHEWRRNPWMEGKIPAAKIARLGKAVDAIVEWMKGAEWEEKRAALVAIRKRMEPPRDWPLDEVSVLLEELNALHPSLLMIAYSWEDRGFATWIRNGQPLPEELKKAAWGPAAPNGLRTAGVLLPEQENYAIGETTNVRILFHNTGIKPVLIVMVGIDEEVVPEVRDVQGKEIEVHRLEFTSEKLVNRYRLAPGEYCTYVTAGILFGKGFYDSGGEPLLATNASVKVKPGDEVRAVWPLELRSRVGELMVQVGRENAEKATPADFFRACLAWEGTPNRAEREAYVKRMTRNVLGVEATPEDVAAFVTDETPQVMDHLVERWLRSPENVPAFEGKMQTGKAVFRVREPERP